MLYADHSIDGSIVQAKYFIEVLITDKGNDVR